MRPDYTKNYDMETKETFSRTVNIAKGSKEYNSLLEVIAYAMHVQVSLSDFARTFPLKDSSVPFCKEYMGQLKQLLNTSLCLCCDLENEINKLIKKN